MVAILANCHFPVSKRTLAARPIYVCKGLRLQDKTNIDLGFGSHRKVTEPLKIRNGLHWSCSNCMQESRL